ncbi:MAG: choice-of-anchor D domain-containing protein, partial [Burkholderiales bacterium]|nr:choice-of-anchor D domain-containing protein [Burkholderiales bacterium]
ATVTDTTTYTVTGGGVSIPVLLSGTGVSAPAASLTASPTSHTFGNVTVGQSSAARTITVTNGGAAAAGALAMSNGNAAEFVVSANTCGSSLAAGASCSLGVTYAPNGTGADSANLSFTFSGGSPVQVALSGTGVAPAVPNVSASPTSLAFGNVAVGQVSAPQTITVSNTGTAAATNMAYPSAPASFNRAGTCSAATLNAGASCTVIFTFSPSAAAPVSATDTITGGGSTMPIALAGVGTAAAAASLSASPTSLAFGTVAQGASSTPQRVTLTNTGNAAADGLTLSNGNAAEFVVSSNTCGTSLAAGASCSLNVAYTPTGIGIDTSTLTFAHTGGPAVEVSLSGAGGPPPVSNLAAIPASVAFGNVTVGTIASQAILLRNSGGAAATGVAVSGAGARFRINAGTCSITLEAGASCTLGITYEPTAATSDAGTVTITSAAASDIVVPLAGTGIVAPSANLKASPSFASFGKVPPGQTSAATTIAVSNTGNAAASGLALANSNGAEFVVGGNTCGAVLNPGAACEVSVAYRPSGTGIDNATLIWSHDAGGSVTVPLYGMSEDVAPPPVVGKLSVPATVSLPDTLLGLASVPQPVTLTNTGEGPVAVVSIKSANAGEFSVSGATCGSVAPGASCTFNVTFAPFGLGSRTATITVTSNADGGPQAIQATGVGLSGAPPPPPPPPYAVAAIEYYHAGFDHYFVTASSAEIPKLDSGAFAGWIRTGKQFNVYPSPSAGLRTACRFFSTAFGERSSHFYTPDAPECLTVQANPNWQFEGDVFYTRAPAQDGTCPAGMNPVYRMYNNGQGGAPNHRYTTELPVRALMLAQGWIPEGYGPVGVIMCAPQ